MVGVGFLLVALGAFALYVPMRHWPEKWMRWLKLMIWAIALPYIANSAGWILTETSRQPWIVYGLLRTQDGMSPNIKVGMLLVTLLGFTTIYAALMVADVYLLVKFSKAGISDAEAESVEPSFVETY